MMMAVESDGSGLYWTALCQAEPSLAEYTRQVMEDMACEVSRNMLWDEGGMPTALFDLIINGWMHDVALELVADVCTSHVVMVQAGCRSPMGV